MFNFSPFKKGDRAIDDMPIRKADDEPKKGDGRFQPGPQTKEKRRGDNSFDTAKGHIDDAADAARAGDQETANYHLSMAHQYAQLGVQNHMMSDFLGKSKALGPKAMSAAPAAKAKKGDEQ
jgi:hypothetical protein